MNARLDGREPPWMEPIDTTEGLVGLTGTVAMVRPGPAATVDDVIDAAVTGLVRARQAEATAVSS